MIIKSICLKNIRSYVEERMDFPRGSLLIEGDIGSGKSTILLAIDFALFGARKGELPASALLRKGATKGEVVLDFSIGRKDIQIQRVLEKKGSTIAQTAGYITINGTRKDLMSTGLKSIVFEILGYPKADVRAGKSPIFRYTVYTPQEQMKEIMLMKADERLNTIRAIFNIDKYKRIRENARNSVREIKKDAAELRGKSFDLEDKFKRQAEILIESKTIDSELKNKESVLLKAKANLDAKNKEKKDIISLSKRLNELMHQRDLKKAGIDNNDRMAKTIVAEIETLEKRISSMKDAKEIETRISELEKSISSKNYLEKQIRDMDEEIRHIERNVTSTLTRKKASEELSEKISGLSQCPTCMQDVAESHKESIRTAEAEKIEKFEKILSIHEQSLSKARDKRKSADEMLKAINESEKELIRLRNESRTLKEVLESVLEKKKRADGFIESSSKLKEQIAEIEKEIGPIKDTDEKMGRIEKELEVLNGENMLFNAQVAKMKQQVEGVANEMKSLEKEIETKKKAKEDAMRLSEIVAWLSDYFEPLLETMEKHILQSIQQDFDAFFRDWFNMLIDDDSLQTRVDSDFTPLIEQNSYETAYEFLSGGEKTSVALAYRLALNQVINRMSDDIKTKKLLILDEPTDGFSSEQLDKVRDVLLELEMDQTIIVSHEEKIEGFVDRTIRVVKNDHKSRVIHAES